MPNPPQQRNGPYNSFLRGKGSAVRFPACTLSAALGDVLNQCGESIADEFRSRWRRKCQVQLRTYIPYKK
eukprot:8445060-Ditylum_brightwellii.AAC.1